MTARVLLALVTLALAPGCGTLVGLGGDREVRVASNPDGVSLLVDGRATGLTTPCVVSLDPAEEHRLDGRDDDMFGGTQVHRSTRVGVVICDVIFTLGFGLWIDYLTGAMYRFPDAVVINVGRAHAPDPLASAEFPPAPRLMPATDPYAPATSSTRNVLQDDGGAARCSVCGDVFGRGDTCASCGIKSAR